MSHSKSCFMVTLIEWVILYYKFQTELYLCNILLHLVLDHSLTYFIITTMLSLSLSFSKCFVCLFSHHISVSFELKLLKGRICFIRNIRTFLSYSSWKFRVIHCFCDVVSGWNICNIGHIVYQYSHGLIKSQFVDCFVWFWTSIVLYLVQ